MTFFGRPAASLFKIFFLAEGQNNYTKVDYDIIDKIIYFKIKLE